MMPDLRARLRAVSDKPRPAAEAAQCLALERRFPLEGMEAMLAADARTIRWLGLEQPGWDVRKALFLDTETTGLRGAGTVAFLVGLGWLEEDAFVVRQLLMRDYPEELPLLTAVAELLPRFDTIVSFNGKSFDVPLLRDRFTMGRLRQRWRELPQLDLLHSARRTWRMRLGACTLGAVEREVLGLVREGDLPGAEVPERFFRYLKSGDITLLDDVLRHNRQDIHTLALLLSRLTEAYAAPEAQTSMLDIFSIGRALERCGEGERARRCFQVASVSDLSRQARLHLAHSYRRERDYDQAAETYRGMIARGEADGQVYTALAILLEWRLGDPAAALDITEKALWRFAGGSLLTPTDPALLESLENRRRRLRGKLTAHQQTGGQTT